MKADWQTESKTDDQKMYDGKFYNHIVTMCIHNEYKVLKRARTNYKLECIS